MSLGSNLPLVSVVMPSFNQAQFIDESIASVLNQSYPRIELIVADGNSTDGTQAALSRWQSVDNRVRWSSEPDRGPADAVNKALRQVRGTYVGWLNSDDLYTTGAVQRAMDKLTSAEGYMLVYGEGVHVNSHGEFVSVYPSSLPQAGIERFAEGCFICQPTVFFRRSMCQLLGYLDISLQTAFDFDYWLRAFQAFPNRIGFVDSVQAKSRLHENCITQKMRRKVALEGAYLLKKHLGRAPLQWILTHFHEARDSGQADLEDYFRQLLDEARPCFDPEDMQVLLSSSRTSGTAG